MDFSLILAWVVSVLPAAHIILVILGGLVVLGQVIVALTPSQADDAAAASILAKPIIGDLLKALMAFAPIQKK